MCSAALGQLPTDNCQRTTANEVTNFTSGQLPTDNCQRTIANAFFSHSMTSDKFLNLSKIKNCLIKVSTKFLKQVGLKTDDTLWI